MTGSGLGRRREKDRDGGLEEEQKVPAAVVILMGVWRRKTKYRKAESSCQIVETRQRGRYESVPGLNNKALILNHLGTGFVVVLRLVFAAKGQQNNRKSQRNCTVSAMVDRQFIWWREVVGQKSSLESLNGLDM